METNNRRDFLKKAALQERQLWWLLLYLLPVKRGVKYLFLKMRRMGWRII